MNRPGMLGKALGSLKEMQLPINAQVRLVVCDNDENAAAKPIIDQYRELFPFEISYFVESNRGIVYARNRILDECMSLGATHIAFFDDDETVDQQWLVEHLNCMNRYKADVVVGKVIFVWPGHIEIHPSLKSKLARRSFPKTGQLQKGAGTTNVFFKVDLVEKLNHRFHGDLNLRGGSDQLFFQMLYDRGARIVWNNEALTYEEVPETRATKDWLFKRRYRYGYTKYFILKIRFSPAIARRKTLSFCFNEFLRCAFLMILVPFSSKGFRINLKGDWLFAKGQLDGLRGKDYFEYQRIHGY